MNNEIQEIIQPDIVISSDYSEDMAVHFGNLPRVAIPLVTAAKTTLGQIEKMLASAPSFIQAVKACVPEQTFRAILTDEQKGKIATGALKLMTKKDGSLMATLVNPDTGKIVSTVGLEKVTVTPELSNAMTNFASQMQMAQLAEQIQYVQLAIEEVHQGQEFDRLAMAYSCQQKLLQAMAIKNPELRAMALIRIAGDAEDSRNALMQSQYANVEFIKNQPESFWGKLLSGAKTEKIESRMEEIRESLGVVNMVSLVEAMAFQKMGEVESARMSLEYYAEFIQKTYLSTPGLVERLDLIDSSPENYWSKTLPEIDKSIQALPCASNISLIGASDGN